MSRLAEIAARIVAFAGAGVVLWGAVQGTPPQALLPASAVTLCAVGFVLALQRRRRAR